MEIAHFRCYVRTMAPADSKSVIPEQPLPAAPEASRDGETGEPFNPPEIEGSLDRAKENLVEYVQERYPKLR